jgi:hypothetical protein
VIALPQRPATLPGKLRDVERRLEKIERHAWPKQPANADTAGATLAQLETEVNELKQALRNAGIIAP